MQAAAAADLFTVTGTVSGLSSETRSFGLSSAEDVFNFPRFESLHTRFGNYTGVEAAAMHIDFRGLPMVVSYPVAESSLLVLHVPDLNIHEEFHGATREESRRAFSDFMKKNGGGILNRIMKRLVAESANDPIAGNPNSLMGQMVANDFANGFTSLVSNAGTKEDNASNLIGIGARVSSIKQDGLRNTSVTIPLSYTIRSDIDPRRQLIFNLPLTYTSVESAKAYNLGFGVAYRLPINDEWTITPSAGYGATGSKDLGAYGQAVSAALTSAYVISGSGYDIAIGNMVGIYKTLKLEAGGYSYNPDIQNLVFRNGVMFSQPVNVFGRKMSIEYSLIDTRYTGTKLYNEGYDEIGVTLGTNKNASSARSFLRAGATYLFSPRSKGFTLNLGYWF
ncbi:hypothetical protein [Noviherbaspirillum aridicola]|nr:hypothetical protein [Noviherbaspirillum aridicola]